MKSKSSRAKSFIVTRNHHLLEMAEDYVEMILDLIALNGEARVCDIAKQLGVSHVTVIRTLERLKKKGYLQSRRPITLTEEGLRLASFCKERHNFLLDYLTTLGVQKEIAIIDVEGMEHHVSKATLQVFQRQLEKIKNDCLSTCQEAVSTKES